MVVEDATHDFSAISRRKRASRVCCACAPNPSSPTKRSQSTLNLGAPWPDADGTFSIRDKPVIHAPALPEPAEQDRIEALKGKYQNDWVRAIAAAHLVGAPESKREEGEPWDRSELQLRAGIHASLLSEGWSPEDLAGHSSVNMLKVIRCMCDRLPRFERTLERYRELLEWRRDCSRADPLEDCPTGRMPHNQSVDTLLTDPSPRLRKQHQMWLGGWKSDYYGFDRYGHPIMAWQLGAMDPLTFLEDFTVADVNTNFIRDLEYNARAQRSSPGLYKQVVVLDLAGLTWAHLAAKFRNPTMAIVRMLQDRYPDGVHHLVIVNTPALFRVAYRAIKSFIDENTQKNITMLSSDRKQWAEVWAAKGIKPDALPTWLGGTMSAHSGVLRAYANGGTKPLPKFEESKCKYSSQRIGAGGVAEVLALQSRLGGGLGADRTFEAAGEEQGSIQNNVGHESWRTDDANPSADEQGDKISSKPSCNQQKRMDGYVGVLTHGGILAVICYLIAHIFVQYAAA